MHPIIDSVVAVVQHEGWVYYCRNILPRRAGVYRDAFSGYSLALITISVFH